MKFMELNASCKGEKDSTQSSKYSVRKTLT